LPEKSKNTFLITHKPNIVDALGKDWFDVKEGRSLDFRGRGRQVSARGARANEGLAEARCRQVRARSWRRPAFQPQGLGALHGGVYPEAGIGGEPLRQQRAPGVILIASLGW